MALLAKKKEEGAVEDGNDQIDEQKAIEQNDQIHTSSESKPLEENTAQEDTTNSAAEQIGENRLVANEEDELEHLEKEVQNNDDDILCNLENEQSEDDILEQLEKESSTNADNKQSQELSEIELKQTEELFKQYGSPEGEEVGEDSEKVKQARKQNKKLVKEAQREKRKNKLKKKDKKKLIKGGK
jgi:RIO kinase 1